MGDKDAIAALSRGEKMIFQPRRSQAYVELDLQDGFDHRLEKYTGTLETIPKRDNFESEDLFIAALENWH